MLDNFFADESLLFPDIHDPSEDLLLQNLASEFDVTGFFPELSGCALPPTEHLDSSGNANGGFNGLESWGNTLGLDFGLEANVNSLEDPPSLWDPTLISQYLIKVSPDIPCTVANPSPLSSIPLLDHNSTASDQSLHLNGIPEKSNASSSRFMPYPISPGLSTSSSSPYALSSPELAPSRHARGHTKSNALPRNLQSSISDQELDDLPLPLCVHTKRSIESITPPTYLDFDTPASSCLSIDERNEHAPHNLRPRAFWETFDSATSIDSAMEIFGHENTLKLDLGLDIHIDFPTLRQKNHDLMLQDVLCSSLLGLEFLADLEQTAFNTVTFAPLMQPVDLPDTSSYRW
ncbi:uncharacterized protein FIBRA_04104 [Fibroporia radiculosa]|uniref:Uncharacterized protein n=1 Tax=Fibroporia radiculosa TaxID=599839 RepID=J4G6U7_9APHY|nr:uncharacterized protein FIBRA_04104 [Fibroporia radiculosa]CCM02028.1 predicted protein [Fibroporia radiculosa]